MRSGSPDNMEGGSDSARTCGQGSMSAAIDLESEPFPSAVGPIIIIACDPLL